MNTVSEGHMVLQLNVWWSEKSSHMVKLTTATVSL